MEIEVATASDRPAGEPLGPAPTSTGADRQGVPLRLRRATPADAESVAAVYVASWNEAFRALAPPRDLDGGQVARWERDLCEGQERWWVAEDEGRVVGFVGTGPSRDPADPALGELDTIAVRPEAWRSGVGRRLMGVALDDLAARWPSAVLWTWAGDGQARRFYDATGWHASGEVRDSGRQVALRRELAPRR